MQSESSVFFVDCDSYQIEGFPCPVGMPPFLAPEIYGTELRSILRTIDHENFAIATLVFMLLHTGKPPYSHQGGEDPLKNVQKRHFPYPRGSQGGQGVPKGPWQFMFSHLPRYMKDAFHEVFSDGHRLSVDTWQHYMYRYENDLSKGYVSNKLFPKNFKKLNRNQAEKYDVPWRSCDRCGEGFVPKNEEHTTCPDCFYSTHPGDQRKYHQEKVETNTSEPYRQAQARRQSKHPQNLGYEKSLGKLLGSLFRRML